MDAAAKWLMLPKMVAKPKGALRSVPSAGNWDLRSRGAAPLIVLGAAWVASASTLLLNELCFSYFKALTRSLKERVLYKAVWSFIPSLLGGHLSGALSVLHAVGGAPTCTC